MFSDILYTVHICTQSSKMRFQAHIDDVVEDTKHGILSLVPSALADFAAELTNISQCTSMWDGFGRWLWAFHLNIQDLKLDPSCQVLQLQQP